MKLDLHLFVYDKLALAAMCSAEVIIELIALESQVDLRRSSAGLQT